MRLRPPSPSPASSASGAPALDPVSPAHKWFVLFFAALAGLVLFSLSDLSATRAFRSPWWLPLTLTQSLPLLALAGLAVTRTLPLRRPGLVAAGVLILWAGGLLSAALSPFRYESLAWSLGGFSLLATGLVSAAALAPSRSGFPARAARWQTLIGACFALLLADSLVLWLVQDLLPGLAAASRLRSEIGPEAWSFSWDAFRNIHPFGHSNYTAGAAVLMIPWFAGLALNRTGRARAGWCAALALALVLLLSSGSRGGLLGLCISAAGAALIALCHGGPRLRRAAFLSFAIGAVLLVAHPRMRETLRTLANHQDVPSSSDLERRSMIRGGLLMGADRPLLGWGPATTPSVFPAYRPRLGVSLENSFQLHSQPVTLWAEGGALAVLGAFLLVLGLGFHARRALARPGPVATCAGAAALSLLGYAGLLCTDTQLDVAGLGLACAVLAALLWACGVHASAPPTATSARTRAPLWQFALAASVLATLAAVATSLVPMARARLALSAAFADFDAGRTEDFLAATRAILDAHPQEFPLANLLASTELDLARTSPDPAAKTRWETAALADWRRSLALRPWQELPHTNLGWLLLPRDPAAALREFQEAARWVPDKRGVHLGQALASLKLSAPRPTVVAALARECLLDPEFILSPLWNNHPFDTLRPDVLRSLYAQLSDLAADPHRPAWLTREALDYSRLLDWWTGLQDAPATAAALTSPLRRACFAALAAPAAPLDDSALVAAWQLLARAAPAAGPERLRLLRAAHARLTGAVLPASADDPRLRTLDRRVSAGWPAVARPRADDLLRTVRYERPGYDILVRNTDFPVLRDAYSAPQTFSSDYLVPLLPRTGWCLPLVTAPPAAIPLQP